MKLPSAPHSPFTSYYVVCHESDPALVVDRQDKSLHMLVAGNTMGKLCVMLPGGVTAQGQQWAFWTPSGWVICPAGLLSLISG